MREGHFEQAAVVGTVSQADGGWRACLGDQSAVSATLVGACIAVTNDATSLLLCDLMLTEVEIAASQTCGLPFVVGSQWIHNDHLTVEAVESVMDHPDFEDVATVWGPEPGSECEGDPATSDERDDNAVVYYKVGRLGRLYFQLDCGPVTWDFIGWFDEPRAAAEAVAFTGDGLTVLMEME